MTKQHPVKKQNAFGMKVAEAWNRPWSTTFCAATATSPSCCPVGARYSVSSCDLRILMDQPTKSISPHDPPSRHEDSWFAKPDWRCLSQRTVRTVHVVMVGRIVHTVLAPDPALVPQTAQLPVDAAIPPVGFSPASRRIRRRNWGGITLSGPSSHPTRGPGGVGRVGSCDHPARRRPRPPRRRPRRRAAPARPGSPWCSCGRPAR